jgi:hypothetical protein
MTTGDAYLHGSGAGAGSAAGSTQTGSGETGAGSGNQGVMDQIKDAGGNLADQATTTAGAVMDQARGQAQSQAEGQRDRLAGTLGSTASALRQTSQKLRDQEQDGVAQLVDSAAERMDGFARYLRERSITDLIGDVERFGRNEPGIFLTAAFGAGLFAARFLKSGGSKSGSTSGSQSSSRSTGYAPLPARTHMYGGAGGYVTEPGPATSYAADRPQSATSGAYAATSAGTAERPNGLTGPAGWNEGTGAQ